MAAINGAHVGIGKCIGLVKDDKMVVEAQCCWTGPRGKDDRDTIITGALRELDRQAIWTVKNVVMELTEKIATHFNKRPEELRLKRPTLMLHLHLETTYQPLAGPYYMGAVFIALVSLVVGRRPRTDTAIFGEVSVTGNFGSGSEWTEEEIGWCRTLGIRRAVLGGQTGVTQEAELMAAVVQEDGKPLVEIIRESFISRTLQHCF